jgi:hypothetical protein
VPLRLTMSLWQPELNSSSIHLAVEGSCGGSSLGIQLSRQVISNGGRVLWAAPELPDSTRFSQIFHDMPLTSSSKFHAMNLVGAFEQSVDALLNAANMLPGVELVVLDDYCPDNGRIPKDIISRLNQFISDSKWTTLLISKGGISMEKKDSNMENVSITARGKNDLNTDQVWLLTRPESDSQRVLWIDDKPVKLRLIEEGFVNPD